MEGNFARYNVNTIFDTSAAHMTAHDVDFIKTNSSIYTV